MRRVYTSEFKKQAVELAESLNSGKKAAEQLGISDSLIYSWRGEFSSSSSGDLQTDASPSDMEELKRLRKENGELKKVNQILKVAAAFFSQDSLK